MSKHQESASPIEYDERWFNFRYQYIETGWFNYDRHKTIEAMRKVSKRLPDAVLDELPAFVVFAPSPRLLGELKPFGLGDRLFLYLSPRLEKMSQKEVDFTVAHEFAHIVLGHYKQGITMTPGAPVKSHEEVPAEIATDKLAESWGFQRPQVQARDRRRKQRRKLG